MKVKVSIKNILLISFVIVAIIPILAIGALSLKSLTTSLEKEIWNKNLILAKAATGELETFLNEPLNLLKQSKAVIESDAILSPGMIDEYLSMLLKNYSYFNMLMVLNSDGIVTTPIPFDENILGADMSRQSYFHIPWQTKEPYWSQTIISPHSGHPILTISLPTKSGVIVGSLDLSYLYKVVERTKIGPQGYILIADNMGITIAHPDRQLVSQRMNISSLPFMKSEDLCDECTFRYKVEGKEMLSSVSHVPQTGWRVAVIQPAEEAFFPIRKVATIILSGTIASVLLTIVIAFLSLRSILRPLIQLTDDSKRIARGDYSYSKKETLYWEIDKLKKSFQVMTGAIKSREEEIGKTKAYLKNILDSISSAIITVNSELKVTQWNKKMSRLLQLDESVVLLLPFTELSSSFAPYKEALERVLREGKELYFPKVTLYELKDKFFDLYLYPFMTDHVEGIVICFDDITERELAEKQLIQAQKLENLSNLAGRLAHDFNNILVGVVTTASLMELELDSRSLDYKSINENINMIKESGQRAVAIVKELLTISSQNNATLEKVNLKEPLKKVVQLCRNSFDSSITIKTEQPGRSAYIKADPNQLEQMILNLCLNASQAMTIMREEGEEPGGLLTIKIERLHIDEEFCYNHPNAFCGNFYLLQISDTGVGIPKESLHKIFTPFFTTKTWSHGKGLGLSLVYNIVKEHKGFITTASEPGKGSTFSIYLPIFRLDGTIVKQNEDNKSLPRGMGRLLIIDDERTVRTLAARIAGNCGYSTFLAANGREGVKVFESHADEIVLVILDLSMPILSGKETYLQLKRLKPDLKVLISSGFSRDEKADELMKMGCKYFIQKPFTVYSFAQMIKRALTDE